MGSDTNPPNTHPAESLTVDPAAVRQFGDEVWAELYNTVKPWITQIRTDLGTEDGPTLGSSGYLYGGQRVSKSQSTSAGHLLAWLSDMEAGVEALAIGSAVISEQLIDFDIKTAALVDKTTVDGRGTGQEDG